MGIVFSIDYINDEGAFGSIVWADKGLHSMAVSGPYGRRELPAGLYHIRRKLLLDKDENSPFCDSLRNCWMQVVEPQFSTNRTDLGIHPDGNLLGTKGCIGILDSNTQPWYEAFKSLKPEDVVKLEIVN